MSTKNMARLHIVQGGVENGDMRWLQLAVRSGATAKGWIVPKLVEIGDDVIIYVGGHGLFATAKIATSATPRADWKNRYGAGLADIKLIRPPISLAVLGRAVPNFKWTIYPRSITTPAAEIARALRSLVHNRRRIRGAELDQRSLGEANLDELRMAALLKASPTATKKQRIVIERKRAYAVKVFALKRAAGVCEFCGLGAPFHDKAGEPYLESHHITRLSDEGPDHPDNVIGICPNCHRRAHFSQDRSHIRERMKKRARSIERRRTA
jgi:5-methylcytosine-specific restriction endonuclease McrA